MDVGLRAHGVAHPRDACREHRRQFAQPIGIARGGRVGLDRREPHAPGQRRDLVGIGQVVGVVDHQSAQVGAERGLDRGRVGGIGLDQVRQRRAHGREALASIAAAERLLCAVAQAHALLDHLLERCAAAVGPGRVVLERAQRPRLLGAVGVEVRRALVEINDRAFGGVDPFGLALGDSRAEAWDSIRAPIDACSRSISPRLRAASDASRRAWAMRSSAAARSVSSRSTSRSASSRRSARSASADV